MVERVRPQRFGLNQNYVFPNKEQSFWQSAPLLYQNKNAITKAIYQYNFDGIDDYAQLPTIPLFAGDMVELQVFISSVIPTSNLYIFDNTSPRTYLYRDPTNALGFLSSQFDVEIDGNLIIAGGSLAEYSDDNFHTIKLTSKLGGIAVSILSSRYTIAELFDNIIKNLRITRANPTDQYPDLFYPMDDGPGTTVMRQVLPTTDNWDGEYVNFNEENWEYV